MHQERFYGETIVDEKLVDKKRKLQKSLVSVKERVLVLLRW